MQTFLLDAKTRRWLADADRGSFCVPMAAKNCTVLGYEVTPQARDWRYLDWSSVVIDGDAAWQYLHVAFKPLDDPGGDCQYRVRCLYDLGDKLRIEGIKGVWQVESVTVAGHWGGKWWWRIGGGEAGKGEGRWVTN